MTELHNDRRVEPPTDGQPGTGSDSPAAEQPDTGPPAILASAPGVGTRIGNLNVTTLGPLGWLIVAAGVLGTLLIAASYLAGWLTGSLEKFGVADTESLSLGEVARPALAWMYRLSTLALISCAVALVFARRRSWSMLRLAGYAAAGLSLFSTLIVAIVISTLLLEAQEYTDVIGYGWGLYAGLAGIVAVTGFVGLFERAARS